MNRKIIPFSEYPVRPGRKLGESLVGYLYRHLSANGYGLGLKHWEVITHYYDQERYGKPSFKAERKELYEFLAWLDDGWIEELQLFWHPLWKAWLKPNAKVVRFCPTCIKRDGFHHQLWEHPLMNACGYHGCQLLANCSECGINFRWRKLSAGWLCRCGVPIAGMNAEKAKPYDLAVARYLTNAWEGDGNDNSRKISQRRLLNACLDLEVASQVAQRLSSKRITLDVSYILAETCKVSRPILGWAVRLVDADKRMLGKRLRRLLQRRLWGEGIVLDRLENIYFLNRRRVFFERRTNCVCKSKLLIVMTAVIKDHDCKLPLNDTVLFNPRWSRTDFGQFLERFGHWWREVAEGMRILDEAKRAAWNSGQCNDGVTESRDVKVFEILQTLTQLATYNQGVKNLLLLRHWWRIPNSLQKPEPLRDTLSLVCSHLCRIPSSELAMVHTLVSVAKPI